MTRRTYSAAGCFLALVAVLPATVHAQVARVELHPFSSTTLTDEEFLLGKKDGKPVVVAGELRIPQPGTDRLPAVVLLHGSGGFVRYVDDWVHRLNALGVATFVVDSFTPRGIVNTNANQDQLGRLAMIIDGYRALALLAHHPRIRPDRIAVMGFSRGGQAAVYSGRMGAVGFVEHAGKRILYVDLKNVQAAVALRLMEEASAVAAREPPRSVLMLIDVVGAGLDPLMGEAVHRAVNRDRAHVRAEAVVGISGQQIVVFNVAAATLGDAIEHFDTPEAAKDWLVSR